MRGLTMGITDFVRTMANVNDVLRVGTDLLNKNNGKLGDRMISAGMNLLGNAMSTSMASSLFNNTGSMLGYYGKFQANGDGATALQNTANMSMMTYQMQNPWGMCGSLWSMAGLNGMYGMNNYMGGGLSRLQIAKSVFPEGTFSNSTFPNNVFQNNFFTGKWC